MARPERNNVDYFPFSCEEGEKMFYIEQTYGNDGFAVFVKILRELARKDFHYLNLSETSSKTPSSAVPTSSSPSGSVGDIARSQPPADGPGQA